MRRWFFRNLDRIRRILLNRLDGVTVGVRAIIRDSDGFFLLVKHTYLPEWYTPGGGINQGESPISALRRELVEELGLYVDEHQLTLHHIYVSHIRGGFDYVVFYSIIAPREQVSICDKYEISEIGWFSAESLPEDTSRRTKTLLRDVVDNKISNHRWL
jgi:8-oxo-dGTP pyrophosphatase MutT (NUDIX family)